MEAARKAATVQRALAHVRTWRENAHDVYYNGLCIGCVYRDRTRKSYGSDEWVETWAGMWYSENHDRRENHVITGKHVPTFMAVKQAVVNEWLAHRKDEEPKITESSERNALPYYAEMPTFYPTPPSLIGKMLSLLNAAAKPSRYRRIGKYYDLPIRYVLEPSAGDGAICDALRKWSKDENATKGSENLDIDCIEIEPSLRRTLCEKGYRVIHDDFRTFTTAKQYDLIIMNPPFARNEGAEHLLKAIGMQQYGGKVLCLLNAETLRNGCDNKRKVLLAKLRALNAQIVYVKQPFMAKDAVRKTAVDIAIVYIDIPKPVLKSDIYEKVTKAAPVVFDDGLHTQGLVLTEGRIEQLVSMYEREKALSLELIRQYNALTPYIRGEQEDQPYGKQYQILKLSIGDYDSYSTKEDSYSYIGSDAMNKYCKCLRNKYWQLFFTNNELMSRFTENLQKKYHELSCREDYDFTVFNINTILDEMRANLKQGVHESIMSMFDTLTTRFCYEPEHYAFREDLANDYANNVHYFNGWKTNKSWKINSKVIIPENGFYASYDGKTKLESRYIYRALSDIEKSLDYLDCDYTSSVSLSNAADQAERTQNCVLWCKYFYVKFYKKGTCHVYFRDDYIVQKLNIYVARNRGWLPPSYGKVKYDDLDEESKSAVESFHDGDVAEYDMICAMPEKFIVDSNTLNTLLLDEGKGEQYCAIAE